MQFPTLMRGAGIAGLLSLSLSVGATTSESLSLSSCFLEGLSQSVQCGTLTVPENWSNPGTAKVQLNVTVIPAIASTPKKDPLFLLMGGPGQAAVELAPMLSRVFAKARQDRELVLIDQRGTGKSSPLLCEDEQANIYYDVFSDFSAEDVKTCLAGYQVDLSQYNTNSAVLDFEAVRKALGYEQINLYGISYGSRAALVYMRDKPEALRSVILDGVVPTQVVVGPMGTEAERAFDILVAQCSEREKCAAQYPNLLTDYQKIKTQLTANTLTTQVAHPVTDKPMTLRVDVKKFIELLRSQMYGIGSRELIPYIISEFSKENYKPFIGIMSQGENSKGKMYTGLTMNILCNEDIPRVTPEQLAAEAANRFSGNHSFEAFTSVCQLWPKFTAPANFGEPVISDIPTMVLSGNLDPVTPPAWGELAVKGLKNSKHYIAQDAGHGLVTQTCAAEMVSDFVKQLSFDDVDESCLKDVPQRGFLLNNNGNW
ncbi:MAG: alpha/beta hydrolase [Gammaproteobacteria bacterium]|nr:alpha/beta hydrolase [Gammaproteobacteria bacterium]